MLLFVGITKREIHFRRWATLLFTNGFHLTAAQLYFFYLKVILFLKSIPY